MTSPLSLFRKYQKTMLAIAAVGAMIAFGILPVISQWQSASGSGGKKSENPILASWQGRQLRAGEMMNLVGRRQALIQFQDAVAQVASQRGSEPRVMFVPRTTDEQNLIETELLAEKAQEMGITISDSAVIQHLEGQLANGTMTRNEIARELQMSTNGRLSQQAMIEAMKVEMAAARLRILASGGAFTGNVFDLATTPIQALSYHSRLMRKMEAEVLAIDVASKLSEVNEQPTEAEIKALYEEHKKENPNPASPEPAFREPRRLAFNWLKADYQSFLDRAKSELSEEELRGYYEENKASYTKVSSLPDSATSEEDAEGSAEEKKDEPAQEYFPFEEVREDIAVSIARPLASKAVVKARTQAMDEMSKFFEDYQFAKATEAELPTPPNLQEMANRLGLNFGEIPLITFDQVDDYEIGSAYNRVRTRTGQMAQNSFVQMAFGTKLVEYRPRQIVAGNDQDSLYVFWKTEEQKAFVPTLDQARENIVKYWKMQKAFDLAVKEGEAIAKKLTDSKQSLATMYEGDASKEIVETGEFSWLSYGGMQFGAGLPRLSTIDGVDLAGEEFFTDASKLKSGDVGVTYNQPKTKAFVVYMKAVTSNEEDLRKQFLSQGNKLPVKFIAVGDESKTARDWFLGMSERIGFEEAESDEDES